MSQVEKTGSSGKNPLRCRGSFAMKRARPAIYNRRCKEEWRLHNTERDKTDESHSVASSGAQAIKTDQGLHETIQPGTVRRLVEKFRSLGESTGSNNRSKKSRMTEEKWILLTPSLFSPNELDSCSISLSQPTIPVIHHQKPNRSAVLIEHRDNGLQDVVLGCEHDVSEIVLPIEYFTIENPAKSHRRLTIGASKHYSPNDNKADDRQIYDEIEILETLYHPDTKNVAPNDRTEENSGDISQKDFLNVNYDAHYEEIEIKPLQEVFCSVPSLVIVRKERIYEEIDAESIPNNSEDLNHSDAGDITGQDSGIVNHPSNSQNFASNNSIYEEIDLSPPMIVLHEQNVSTSSSYSVSSTLDSNKSENSLLTVSQYEDNCSACDAFDESSSTDSIISDLDDYDIVYKSEILGLEFSRSNSDTPSGDLKNVHGKKSVQNTSTSTQHSSFGSDICRKPCNKPCQHHGVYSNTMETSKCRKNTDETGSGSNDDKNIYENYHFTPVTVSCQTSVNSITKSKHVAFDNTTGENGPKSDTGCRERGLSTDTASESNSINSFSSSSYESFSSDDEYEDAPSDHRVLMQRAEEEPPSDSGTEEPVTKLDRIIREIIDTERRYIERLKLINDEFRVAMTAWNLEKNYIPEDIIRQMFLNIDVIYQLHYGFFLPELEACMNKEMRRNIEDVFVKGADFLKLYAEYSFNFSRAMKLIEQWKSKVPELSRFIQGIQQKPICRSLTLEHHMLEPILRIPRYELLLNKYLEHLPEDSLKREKCLKAIQKVTAAASHCNDFIKSMEKYRKVRDVQQSLWNKVDLMTPSRELVLEGRMKVTQQLCKDEDKHLFLFNDTLLVCKIFPLGITPPYKMTLRLDIDGMQVVDRHREEVVETFFVISKQGYLEMHPGSMKEKEKWISALNSVITKYTALEKSRHKSKVVQNSRYSRQRSIPGTQAPIWIKDPQANRCMHCCEKFTAIKRRHHCRACGIVVCGKCSSKEASLAFDNFLQHHRVCDKCFSEISSSTKDDNESEPKVSRPVVKNVPCPPSKKDAADNERRTSTFFLLPCDEHSPSCDLKSKEEKPVAELTSTLDAIVESDNEAKDGQQVT